MALAKKKSATARATMHNWSPAGARKASPKKVANKKPGKKKKHHNPGTALAKRPAMKIAKKNPGSKPAKVSQLSEYRLKGNPGSFSDIGTLGKTAIVGLGGGVASRTLGALELGLMDRFGLSGISQNKFASPVATAVNAWLFVPTLGRWVGISPQSQQIARLGGILFAAADGLNSLIGGVQDTIVNKARQLASGNVLTNGNTNADAVKQLAAATQQAAIDAGIPPDVAASAAAQAAGTALEGLEGIPQENDLALEQDYF